MSDVLIVGAGVIGCSVAHELARRGARVTVLDMRAPGLGATQASAGVLAPYIEAGEDTPLLEMCTRSLGMFDDFIAAIVERSGRAIEYSKTGTLEAALQTEDVARFAHTRGALERKGVAHEWLDAAGLRDFEPAVTSSALGGLFVPCHAFVGVASLVKALVTAARASGAQFESPVEAVRIDAVNQDESIEIRAGTRRYRADRVVVAAGSWSSRIQIAGAAVPGVRPIRGQLLHLTWKPGTAERIGQLPARVVWGPRCYTVPWSDGSLLVGATVEDVGFDETTTAGGVEGLLSAVGELLPRAAAAALAGVRVGLRPASADGLPIIAPLPSQPRVVMATGHYRNGILLAPLTAEMVASLVLH